MIIRDALTEATERLREIPEPGKEVLTLLGFVLHKEAAWLLAHDRDALGEMDAQAFAAAVARRARHEPMAYITGFQPFYGHDFLVTPDVLIPRPESELILEEMSRDFSTSAPLTIIDVGTGSGCLGISAALLFPRAEVLALDISVEALVIAEKNKMRLSAGNVRLQRSDLLNYGLEQQIKADVIIANLPYLPAEEVAASPTSGELKHEPELALIAGDQGLALIKRCVQQASHVLKKGGILYLEMLPEQIPLFSLWLMMTSQTFSTRLIQDLSGQNRILALTNLVG